MSVMNTAGYQAGKSLVYNIQNGTQRFKRETVKAAVQNPSFGTVMTQKELLQSIDEQLEKNKQLYGNKLFAPSAVTTVGYPAWCAGGITYKTPSDHLSTNQMGRAVNGQGAVQRTYQILQEVEEAGTSNIETYKKYLESKYGKVTIKDVSKDQKTLEKLGKSMGGNDVVIAPNILEEMANNLDKADYYEQKIDYFFNTIIPRETAYCAARGLVFEPAGVVVHKDGTVTYICGCSDSPERVAQVNAINKAKQEKKAALRKASLERSKEEADRRAQEIELRDKKYSIEKYLAGFDIDAIGNTVQLWLMGESV